MCPAYESSAQSFYIILFPPKENHYEEKFSQTVLKTK